MMGTWSWKSVVATSLLVATSTLIQSNSMASSPSAQPRLSRLSPDNGPAGPAYPLQVTISGSNFAAKDNVIQFGPMRLESIPSDDGRTIVFQVPKVMRGRSEAPPLVFTVGDYEVSVTTPAGTSNSLNFRLTPGN